MKFLASTCAALVAAVACTVVSAAPHEGHAAAAMNATAADNSTTTTNTTTTPATATPVAGNDSDITSLIAGLNGIGNFKILSGLLAQFPEEVSGAVVDLERYCARRQVILTHLFCICALPVSMSRRSARLSLVTRT